MLLAVCGGIFGKFVKRNKYLMVRYNIPTRIYARPRRTISIVSLHCFRSAITAKRRCHRRNGVVFFSATIMVMIMMVLTMNYVAYLHFGVIARKSTPE